MRELLSKDTRDTDEILGFSDTVDTSAWLVERLCDCRASSLAGLVTKADLAVALDGRAGDRAERIALSMAPGLHAIVDNDDA